MGGDGVYIQAAFGFGELIRDRARSWSLLALFIDVIGLNNHTSPGRCRINTEHPQKISEEVVI